MKYQLTQSTGEKYLITEEEASKILKLKGLTFVPSINGYINLSFTISVIPEDKIDKSSAKTGVLHDGTRVVKRFGEWKNVNNPSAILDAKFYPEVARDEVLTELEYNETKLLK